MGTSLTLTFTVTYGEGAGAFKSALKANLLNIVEQAVLNGAVTDALDVEVSDYTAEVK